MNEILTFRIGIDGLENKIWREIEIPCRRTVADLAYTILASFNSLAYHLYDIEYKDYLFDCWVCPDDKLDIDELSNAVVITLGELNLKVDDTMKMRYDYGSTTTFKIIYLGSKELKSFRDQELYPMIINGEGLGMLDDMCDFELKDIVEDIDKLGVSNHYFTPGYETSKRYDYRKYNIKKDNRELKGKILAIKNGYEVGLK